MQSAQARRRPQTAVTGMSRKDNKANQDEESKKREVEQEMIKKYTRPYKETLLLNEGQSLVIIEHCTNCVAHNMSTKHDESKYRRYAENYRMNILRDFPSVLVNIKPNKHEDSNLRIGCFEIWYFIKRGGEIESNCIFSKLVYRKWPGWQAVQKKIKENVRTSTITLQISSATEESQHHNSNENPLSGVHLDLKSLVFQAGDGRGSTATTKSNSRPNTSQGFNTAGRSGRYRVPTAPKKVQYESNETDDTGVCVFENIPLGHYCIVFKGNKNFKQHEVMVDVDGTESEVFAEMDLEPIDEAYFSFLLDTQKFDLKIDQLNEEKIHNKDNALECERIGQEIKIINNQLSFLKNIKVQVAMIDDDGSDDVAIPVDLTEVQKDGRRYFEAVLEPGNYKVLFSNGKEETVVEKRVLQKGLNTSIYSPGGYKEEDQRIEKPRAESKKSLEKESSHNDIQRNEVSESKKLSSQSQKKLAEPSSGGNDHNQSNITEKKEEESVNRISSAYIKEQGRQQTPNELIERMEAEEDEMFENADLDEQQDDEDEYQQDANNEPQDGDEVDDSQAKQSSEFEGEVVVSYTHTPAKLLAMLSEVSIIGEENPRKGGAELIEGENSWIFVIQNLAEFSDRYIRLVIDTTCDNDFEGEVSIDIAILGESYSFSISADEINAASSNSTYDLGVICGSSFVYIGIFTQTLNSNLQGLSELKALATFIRESSAKYTIRDIFGFKEGEKSVKEIDGDFLRKKSDIAKSLENFTIDNTSYILDAFKPSPKSSWLSFNICSEKLNDWKNKVELFDNIQEEDPDEEEDYNDAGYSANDEF